MVLMFPSGYFSRQAMTGATEFQASQKLVNIYGLGFWSFDWTTLHTLNSPFFGWQSPTRNNATHASSEIMCAMVKAPEVWVMVMVLLGNFAMVV